MNHNIQQYWTNFKSVISLFFLLCLTNPAFAQTDSTCYFQECVFPGDANYDQSVDQYDWLAIGLTHNWTGSPRTTTSINFSPQTSIFWNNYIPNTNIDAKHTDCNGDGIVNLNDFPAISQNFNRTHNRLNATNRVLDAPIVYLEFDDDSLEVEDNGTIEFHADIMVGTDSEPANDLYGLAFSISYQADLLEPTTPLTVEYDESCWFGDITNVQFFNRDDRPSAQLDIAMTRLNHQPTTGNGRVARISGIIAGDNINGRNIKRYLTLNVFGTMATNAQGMLIPMQEGSDSLGLSLVVSTNNSQKSTQFYLSPNPIADNYISITAITNTNKPITYRICNSLGQILEEGETFSKQNINVNYLPTGMYYIQCTQGDRQQTIKLIKS